MLPSSAPQQYRPILEETTPELVGFRRYGAVCDVIKAHSMITKTIRGPNIYIYIVRIWLIGTNNVPA